MNFLHVGQRLDTLGSSFDVVPHEKSGDVDEVLADVCVFQHWDTS
jgi:hypothetical protein